MPVKHPKTFEMLQPGVYKLAEVTGSQLERVHHFMQYLKEKWLLEDICISRQDDIIRVLLIDKGYFEAVNNFQTAEEFHSDDR